jgi:hypothetical protein
MVYDRQPIVDYFRRIGHDELAGMMVVEGDRRRYFFRLRRVDLPGPEGVGESRRLGKRRLYTMRAC